MAKTEARRDNFYAENGVEKYIVDFDSNSKEYPTQIVKKREF